jgi:phosphatidylglycerol:prolipoprotein diacylglycerol transferase
VVEQIPHTPNIMSIFPSRAILLSIGPVAIHWYGVMYAIAFVLGIFLLPVMAKKRGFLLSRSQLDSLFLSLFLGVLLGGRIGFVLFYGSTEYLVHPLRIFAVWEGGMSSHGGFIGVIIALIAFSRQQHVSLLRLADSVVVPVAIGLALGRLGNFINGELYGTVTSLPWGMYFPGAEGLRHPTQLYAVLKDLLIATICYLHLRVTQRSFRPGATAALFLIQYSSFRFFVEYFRDQPYGFVSILGWSVSYGQLYTIPLFIFGVGFYCWVMRFSPRVEVCSGDQ